MGVDADPEMIVEARRRADAAGADAIAWRQLRAEDLPADLGTFRVATFAQSFHWMDQPLVARRVRTMLDPAGAWIHVDAATHRGSADGEPLAPPWGRIDDLIADYLGPVRRAGRGSLPAGTRTGEEEVMRQVGFTGPTTLDVGGGVLVDRSVDEIVAAVFSLSSSAPHLFAHRLDAFEADLRRLLLDYSSSGGFVERTSEVSVVIWPP